MVYRWYFALYGLFQVALILSPLAYGQVTPTNPPILTSYSYSNTSPFLPYLYKYVFERAGVSSTVSFQESMGISEYVLTVDFGTGVKNLVDNNNTTIQNVGCSGVFIWQSGGLALSNGIDSEQYQVAIQLVLRFHRIGNQGQGTGQPYYLVFWNTVEAVFNSATIPSISDLPIVPSSYCLPFALNKQQGYILYPFNCPAYGIQVNRVIPTQANSTIENFRLSLVGYSPLRPWGQSSDSQFYVVTTNTDFANRAYFINANHIAKSVTGFQDAVSASVLNWPLNNYIDHNLSIGGALAREGFPTNAGNLDYDEGGQKDLSEWIVNKNRNDPTDDDRSQNQDPQVNPPPDVEWPEGQNVVDLGKDTFTRYERYWETTTGYYAPLSIKSTDTSLDSIALTPIEDEIDEEEKVDVLSRTQSLESDIESAFSRWQIYRDLKALISPLESTAPFKYDFQVEFEIPSLLLAQASSSSSSISFSESATMSSSSTFTVDTPTSISLGSFSFDMSFITENTTAMSYIRKFRSVIHFVLLIMLFFKIINMILASALGVGNQSSPVQILGN